MTVGRKDQLPTDTTVHGGYSRYYTPPPFELIGSGTVTKFLSTSALPPGCTAGTQCVLDALEQERFLVLPHPDVLEYFRRKASDYERWLRGMRRLQMAVSGG